jgi:hypothetical protein
MSLEKRESYKWAKYRWECMRRNPKVLKALNDTLGKAGIADFFLRQKVEENALAGFAWSERVGANYFSSDYSFDEIISKIRKDNPGVIGEILAYALINSDHAVKYDALSNTKIKIEIDFNQVYSLESLKRLVSEMIESLYLAAKKLKEISPKKRPNMTDFDVILKVGDMKRQGKKNREIAQAIDPRKYAENPESAIRLIGYYHKRYKKQVDGNGFFDLTYP